MANSSPLPSLQSESPPKPIRILRPVVVVSDSDSDETPEIDPNVTPAPPPPNYDTLPHHYIDGKKYHLSHHRWKNCSTNACRKYCRPRNTTTSQTTTSKILTTSPLSQQTPSLLLLRTTNCMLCRQQSQTHHM